MHKRIIVTDLTRMSGFDVCVAGVEAEPPHCCIRPQLTSAAGGRTHHPTEQWLHSATGGPLRPFSLVSFDAFDNASAPPHTEDWRVSDAPVRVDGILAIPERRALLELLQQPSIDDLFGTQVVWQQDSDGMRSAGHTEPGSGTASLATLHVELHDVTASVRFDDRLKYYTGFSDAAGSWNRLKITDLSFIYWAESLRRAHGSSAMDLTRALRSVFRASGLETWVRVGLARQFAPRGGQNSACYLQITGIYTFPDYLDDAAWCDFERPHA